MTDPREAARLRIAIVASAFSGFVALSYEIVWYRVLSVMTRGTAATFGLLLAAYLFGIAFGSWGAGRACKEESGGDPHALARLGGFVAVANVLAMFVAPVCAWTAAVTDVRGGLLAVAIAAGFLGAVLPLLSHFGVPASERAGQKLSYVYLANIVGSAAGSLLTGFVTSARAASSTSTPPTRTTCSSRPRDPSRASSASRTSPSSRRTRPFTSIARAGRPSSTR